MRVSILIILLFPFFTNCSGQRYVNKDYADYKVYRNIKKALRNKSDVRVLVLASKNLSEFPLEILELENLKVLNLTNNQLSEIPSEIKKLKALERLELMQNDLTSLPETIAELKRLKRINVAYNDVDDKSVSVIQEALPECFIITEIIL